VSLLTVIDSLGVNINFIHKLPFSSFGFNWIIPAIIGGFIGFIFSHITSKKLMFFNFCNKSK
jgi:LIVCS family branched-chain amino acid:cation transporter